MCKKDSVVGLLAVGFYSFSTNSDCMLHCCLSLSVCLSVCLSLYHSGE